MQQSVAAMIATQCDRIARVTEMNNEHTKRNITDAKAQIERIASKHLPHGSGFDRGCEVDPIKSSAKKLVILAPFHHMDEHGHYDGWEYYRVSVTSDLMGLQVKVSGGRKEHRDHIADILRWNLGQVVNM